MQARWSAWRSFETSVSPNYITESTFNAARDLSPVVVAAMVGYGYGQVTGLVTSAGMLIKGWSEADAALLRSAGKVNGLQQALKEHLELTCRRLEELLLFAGHVSRLVRLLAAVRELRAIAVEGCHHAATKIAPVLAMLAGECSHDLGDTYSRAAATLSTDLVLERLPPGVRRYFEEARDNLLLQHDELAALASCRGFERGCKLVASAHSLTLVAGAAQPRPLSECDLNDVLEAFSRSRWADGRSVLDKADRSMVQFVRQSRNVAGHAAVSPIDEWREIAILAAAATARLLESSGEPNQTITPLNTTKNW